MEAYAYILLKWHFGPFFGPMLGPFFGPMAQYWRHLLRQEKPIEFPPISLIAFVAATEVQQPEKWQGHSVSSIQSKLCSKG